MKILKITLFAVAIFSLIAILIAVTVEKVSSQAVACSAINKYPYSGTGSASSTTNGQMTQLYSQAALQCDATMRVSLEAAMNSCKRFCLDQSTPQTLCIPKPSASKARCAAVPHCSVQQNPLQISCSVTDSDVLKCSCKGASKGTE